MDFTDVRRYNVQQLRSMKVFFNLLFLLITSASLAQQVADTAYQPVIKNKKYDAGKGPVIQIDRGHHNFHTREGRYKPFASLLERDGYVVMDYDGDFTSEKLAGVKILVIANALHESNETRWSLPVLSAFTAEEVNAVKTWVDNGGRLFLIADHMPMGGAAKDLAAAFGFEFTNGFAVDTAHGSFTKFSLKEGTLVKSELTDGEDGMQSLEEVSSFTGQAFKSPPDATPILVFDNKHTNFLPDTAWAIRDHTPRHDLKGWHQGSFKKSGKGKVVMFGEAAMFTAQLAGKSKQKVGMNSKNAVDNYKLLLNIIHWLNTEN